MEKDLTTDESEIGLSKAKQSKAKQSKAKQSKAKQVITMLSNNMFREGQEAHYSPIATTIMSREYKGIGNTTANIVIEIYKLK